jgi:hypothetical protein
MVMGLRSEIPWKDQDLIKIMHVCNMVSDWSSYYTLMRLTHDIQLLKKLSQCLAILKRLVYGKSNKLHNNLKIIYVILGHLGSLINLRSCDLD